MEIKNYLEQPNTKNWLNTKFKNEKENKYLAQLQIGYKGIYSTCY
ncbi:hypothetical protein [Spiroplasma endosymbiont of Polydrusus cervinus]